MLSISHWHCIPYKWHCYRSTDLFKCIFCFQKSPIKTKTIFVVHLDFSCAWETIGRKARY